MYSFDFETFVSFWQEYVFLKHILKNKIICPELNIAQISDAY